MNIQTMKDVCEKELETLADVEDIMSFCSESLPQCLNWMERAKELLEVLFADTECGYWHPEIDSLLRELEGE